MNDDRESYFAAIKARRLLGLLRAECPIEGNDFDVVQAAVFIGKWRSADNQWQLDRAERKRTAIDIGAAYTSCFEELRNVRTAEGVCVLDLAEEVEMERTRAKAVPLVQTKRNLQDCSVHDAASWRKMMSGAAHQEAAPLWLLIWRRKPKTILHNNIGRWCLAVVLDCVFDVEPSFRVDDLEGDREGVDGDVCAELVFRGDTSKIDSLLCGLCRGLASHRRLAGQINLAFRSIPESVGCLPEADRRKSKNNGEDRGYSTAICVEEADPIPRFYGERDDSAEEDAKHHPASGPKDFCLHSEVLSFAGIAPFRAMPVERRSV